jgi:hypothetical protein
MQFSKVHRLKDSLSKVQMTNLFDLYNAADVYSLGLLICKVSGAWAVLPRDHAGDGSLLAKDDEYNGHFFKKGTVFHPNQW